MRTLDGLIAEAKAITSPGPNWVMDGGRACPIGWLDCSQPVFRDRATDAWDYGEPGGPGWADCKANCSHSMQPAPVYEDEEIDGDAAIFAETDCDSAPPPPLKEKQP